MLGTKRRKENITFFFIILNIHFDLPWIFVSKIHQIMFICLKIIRAAMENGDGQGPDTEQSTTQAV